MIEEYPEDDQLWVTDHTIKKVPKINSKINYDLRVTQMHSFPLMWCWCLWGFYVCPPCSGIADKYFFFLLGLRPLHISCVGVGGLSPISIPGVYSGKRSMSAGSSGSNFVGFGSEPICVHLVCVDRSLFCQYCWNSDGLGVAVVLVCLRCFICRGVDVGCLCLNTSCILTNGFPFRLPLVHTLGVSSPGGWWEVLLFFSLFFGSFITILFI